MIDVPDIATKNVTNSRAASRQKKLRGKRKSDFRIPGKRSKRNFTHGFGNYYF
jgi:hypothetical protein